MMSLGLRVPKHVFVWICGVLLQSVVNAGLLSAVEPGGESPTREPEGTLSPAQEGTQPMPAPDETVAAKPEQTDFRTWTDVSGKHRTEAAFIGFENGQVRLEKRDGARITIPIDRLAEADQEFVKTRMALGANEEEAPAEAGQTEAGAKVTSPESHQAQLSPKDAEATRTTAVEEPAREGDPNQVDSGVAQDAMATEPETRPGSTPSSEEGDQQPEGLVEEGLPDSPKAASPSAPEAEVPAQGQERPVTVQGTRTGAPKLSGTTALLLSLCAGAVAIALVVVLKRRWTGGPRKFARKVSTVARRGERVKKAIGDWAAAELEYSALAAALVTGGSSIAETLVARKASEVASFTEPLSHSYSAVISRFQRLASDLSTGTPVVCWHSQDEDLVRRFRENLAKARGRFSKYTYYRGPNTRVVLPAHRRVVVELKRLGSMFEETVDSARQLSGAQRKPEQQAQAASGARRPETSQVVFVREERNLEVGGEATCRVYEASSKDAAVAFLRQNQVTQDSLHLVVETPEGNYRRDRTGIYKEST